MYLLSSYMKANRQDKIYRQKEYRKKQKREKKLPSKNSNLDCEALCSDCTKSEAGVWSSCMPKDIGSTKHQGENEGLRNTRIRRDEEVP